MRVCENGDCGQEIIGEYIVDEEGYHRHPFCRSSEYQVAYEEFQASDDKPLGKAFFNFIKWSGGVTKKEYKENLKRHGKSSYTYQGWNDCPTLGTYNPLLYKHPSRFENLRRMGIGGKYYDNQQDVVATTRRMAGGK
jgi:hypothetical protein